MASLVIGLTFDLRSEHAARGLSPEETAEFTEDETVDAIQDTLQQLGHRVDRIGNLVQLIKRLAAVDPQHGDYVQPWDLVFNICEGRRGRARGGQIPALLDAYDIRYTFADAATLNLVLDKAQTKVVLQHYGVPTAPFIVVPGNYTTAELAGQDVQSLICQEIRRNIIEPSPRHPLFVKPALENSSKGINDQSRVTSLDALWSSVIALREKFPGQDIVVEQFADGREFTVSIIGTGENARVLGISEYIWLPPTSNTHRWNGHQITEDMGMSEFQTYETKMESFFTLCNDVRVDLDQADPEARTACDVALRAYRVVRCRDLGRVDVRSIGIGKEARPQVLEINAIAGLQPRYSDLPRTAEREGISYKNLIEQVIQSAMNSGA